METVIEARNIVKSFRAKVSRESIFADTFYPSFESTRALDDVSMVVQSGEIFGLLGANGAGKTTLLKCFTGIITPDEGTVYINNREVHEAKMDFGAMFGTNFLYHRITGYDNLKFFSKLYDVKDWKARIAESVKEFGLEKHIHRYVETYSVGTKTKLAIARATIHDPKILFLDEPTMGLDPIYAASIRNIIKNSGKTVFITTHYMEEAEELCDRIAIISAGRIVGMGTAEELKKNVESHTAIIVEMTFPKPSLMEELKKCDFVFAAYQIKKGLKILLRHKNDFSDLLLVLGKYHVAKIEERETSMDDVFVKLSGEALGA